MQNFLYPAGTPISGLDNSLLPSVNNQQKGRKQNMLKEGSFCKGVFLRPIGAQRRLDMGEKTND